MPLTRTPLRSVAGLLVLTFSLFVGLVFTTQTAAYAFKASPVRQAYLSTSMWQRAVTAAASAASAGSAAAAPVVAPLAVAGAGLAIGYAVGTAGTAAVSWAWDWASKAPDGTNANPGYADPAPTSAGATVEVGVHTAGTSTVTKTTARLVHNGPPAGTLGASGVITVSLAFAWPTGAGFETHDIGFWDSHVFSTRCGGTGGAGHFFNARSTAMPPSGTFSFSCPAGAAISYNFGWGANSFPATQQPGTSTTPGTTVVTTTPRACFASGVCVNGAPVTYTGNTPADSLPNLDVPASPDGTMRTEVTFPTTSPAGPVAPPLPRWMAPDAPPGFPDCTPVGTCVLVLRRLGVDGQVTNCTASTACAGWQTQTQRVGPKVTVRRMTDGVDVQETPRAYPNGDTLDCKWGPYAVPVDECGTVPTEPNTATPPATGTAPGGEVEGQDCLGAAVSLSKPWTWVTGPVKCALVWAFVPKTVGVQLDALRADLGAKPPGSVLVWGVEAVPGAFAGYGAGAGCTALPDFDPNQQGGLQLPCAPDFDLFRFGFHMVELFIYGLALLKLWAMAQSAMGGKGMVSDDA